MSYPSRQQQLTKPNHQLGDQAFIDCVLGITTISQKFQTDDSRQDPHAREIHEREREVFEMNFVLKET
jgi:hypothetical protein